MLRPDFRLAGPVLDASRPLELAHFYERLLGWPIAEQEGPGPGNPPEAGWAILRSPDRKQKIEIQWERHYTAPTWPPAAGDQLTMIHLDFGVSDLDNGVRWAIECGAMIADHQPHENVRTMRDPEGHPFCIFRDVR